MSAQMDDEDLAKAERNIINGMRWEPKFMYDYAQNDLEAKASICQRMFTTNISDMIQSYGSKTLDAMAYYVSPFINGLKISW